VKLVNVRLGPDDARLVAELKARGASLSDVVRRALRAEAAVLSARAVKPAEILAEIAARYPTPGTARHSEPLASRDARAARRFIRSRLRRRR
jgi:hypothetical protein